jgi:linoleoyl-CoA desaturase
MGLISCALVGGFAHEYCHSTLTGRDNRPNLTSALCGAVWPLLFPFMPEKYFQYEHFNHHKSPMDSAYDYEVYGLRRLIRLSRDVPHRWYFKYQQFYAPLVYSFYITIQILEGYISPYFCRRRFLTDRSIALSLYTAPVVTALFHVAIPVALVGWGRWLLCFSLYNMVWQFTTYLVAAVVHMTYCEEVRSDNWAYRVCAQTSNVLCRNRFYGWLSGGFNLQVDHHLLPSISRESLPLINDIVKFTCQEFNYPYHEYRSFWPYLGDHYRYLRSLGRPSGQ